MYLHRDFRTLEKKLGEKKKNLEKLKNLFMLVRQREPSVIIIFLLEFDFGSTSVG